MADSTASGTDTRVSRDWRTAKPAWQPPRDVSSRFDRLRAWLRRAGRWVLSQIHEDPRERQIIFNYLLIATWVVMCFIGVMAATAGKGVHP